MAAIAIPEDVAAHLQAAIQLSNRRVQMRLLREAVATSSTGFLERKADELRFER